MVTVFLVILVVLAIVATIAFGKNSNNPIEFVAGFVIAAFLASACFVLYIHLFGA